MQEINSINILDKFSLFDKLWTPHIIGELNGQYVKLCKVQDDFVWHSHDNEDELFMVFKGTLLMDFRDGRTVEVKEGEILIDDINIKNVTLQSLRQQIGIVPQETNLFSGTIADNIAFGQTEFDLQQVEKAAKIANAHQFISELSQKRESRHVMCIGIGSTSGLITLLCLEER